MRTCALVAASDFNATHFMSCDADGVFDSVVAVDAGFAHLKSINRTPDLVLGDFDSLGYVPDFSPCKTYEVKKDKSDLELAFDWICEQDINTVWVYGALAGRLDHTLAALQLLAHFAECGMTITGVGDISAVRVLVGPDTFEIPHVKGGVVSVFAANDVVRGVTECGLEYSLEDATLTNRTSLGLSNELIGQPASVSVREGTLYVFYPLAPEKFVRP